MPHLYYFLDLEVRIRFCVDNCAYDGCVYMVYRPNDRLEVSTGYATKNQTSFIILNRTRFRREANQADNKAASLAVDSLINYEAVKVKKGLPMGQMILCSYFLTAFQQREI